MPRSPCAATLNWPFVSRLSCAARSSTRTVVFVPVPMGSQPRLANVKVLVVLFRQSVSPAAELRARMARESVAATTCSVGASAKLKVKGTQ